MGKPESSKLAQLYKSTVIRSYALGFVGFIIGVKLCDYFFYDIRKHEVEMELMEDEFWKVNGEPKHLKPELVQSIINPTKIRKSWIQIVYGKDKYLSKEQYED
jgi:hypothetical protein